VGTKTPAAKAMAGALTTINNQLKAAAEMVTKTSTMTAMMTTIKTKAMAAVAAAWRKLGRRRSIGGGRSAVAAAAVQQHGGSSSNLVAAQWRRQQQCGRQCGGSVQSKGSTGAGGRGALNKERRGTEGGVGAGQ
jgi:hypothetical protein